MTPALLDTNILIDYFAGRPEAAEELALYTDVAISTITWIETLIGGGAEHEPEARQALAFFRRVELSEEIAERTVQVRRQHRLKLPDAVIFATALVSGRVLLTRNTRDFRFEHPALRIPYRL